VRFVVDCVGLGALLPNGRDAETIPADTVLELPFWLAKALHLKGVAVVDTPKIFSPTARGHLKADPSVLTLRTEGDFYQIGIKFAELTNDPELLPAADGLLAKVFAARHQDIINKSQSWMNEDFSKFLSKLTPVELHLFAAGRAASVDFANWKKHQGSFLAAGTAASAHSTSATAKRQRFY
jgi:GINS complex subunit 3